MMKGPNPKTGRRLAAALLACLTALGIAYGLKRHYSRAGGEALAWILRPTAGLVEILSGIPFEPEGDAGYLNRERRVFIAPACAGVNFLIIAFCAAAFSGVFRLRRPSWRFLWIGISLLWAYAATLWVNALRITASIHLQGADIYAGGITPDRVHRIGGTALYVLFLFGFHLGIRRLLDRIAPEDGRDPPRRRLPAGLAPLFWYLAVVLGIPLFTAAFREDPGRFTEHALMVVAVSLGIWALTLLLGWGLKRGRAGTG